MSASSRLADAGPLEGSAIRLVPLSLDHVDALSEVLIVPDLWRWTPMHITSGADMRDFVERTIDERERGESVPFTTIERASGRVVGLSRNLALEERHRRVEIGGTIIAPAWQRTRVNTEGRYLMLRHAFERWRCARVELKTDARNVRSREAILRIGAVEEGTLRKHMWLPDGTPRDSVYFSILDDEWPGVKKRLEEKLAR
jgi:RimJ/RimL family protein N-acetyltransferase